MIRRSALVAFELLAGLVAGVAILGGVAAWRLSVGPVSLDWLKPYVERALSDPGGEFAIAIDRTELMWHGEDHSLVVRASQVVGRDSQGRSIAALPGLSVRFSGAALLRGLIAPTEVELIGPSARLVRTPAGRFDFALADAGPESSVQPAAGATGQVQMAERLIVELLAPPRPDRALGYLRRVSLVGGAAVLDDRIAGRVWRAPSTDIRLSRDDAGLRASLSFTLELAGQRPRFDGDLLYRPEADSIDVAVTFTDLEPSWLAAEAPGLAVLNHARLPVGGMIALRLNSELMPQAVRFDLAGKAGTLVLPELYQDPIDIRGVEARGTADLKAGRLEMDRLFVDLGGPNVTINGLATGLAGGAAGRMDALAVVRDMPVDLLPLYWPRALAADARTWILANIQGGRAPETWAAIVLRLPSADQPAPAIESLTGNMAFEGLTVHYFKPLPPVIGVAGTATFTRERFDINVRQGALKQLRVEQATIKITDLHVKDQDLVSEIVVGGPLRDALEVLDSSPLRYVRKIGMNPADTSGRVAARLVFELPLEKKLTLEQVKLAAAANLREVSQANAMFGLTIGAGTLALKLDGRGMTLDGSVNLNDHPAQVEWRENFADGAPFRRRVHLTGELDDWARERFGIAAGDILKGTIGADLTYTENEGGRARLQAALDLKPTVLTIAPALWSKPAGAAGTAAFSLDLAKGLPVAMPELSIMAEGLDLRGRVDFAGDGSFQRASFDRIKIGDNDLSGRIEAMTPGGYAVKLDGRQLDARSFLKDEESDPLPGPPLRLAGRFDRVLIDSGHAIDQVSVELDHDGRRPRLLVVDGRLGEEGRLLFQQRAGAGTRNIVVASDAAGELLRRLDLSDKVRGGRLRLTGTIEDAKPGRPTSATLEIHDFHVVDAPALVRVLTVASLTGMRDLAAGEGIAFTRLNAEFKRTGRVAEFSDALAFGPALGIRVSGTVDQAAETLQINGTLIPAYSFNEVIGRIPLLGAIITGGKGIFAANFNARGPIDDPNVTVNLLSSLAPGFLGAFLDKLFNPGPNQAGNSTSPPNVFRDIQRQ
ncbi:MAG: hypothetical protein EXQ92_10280 [Alphaproteobacteria bacterium]|nr:hypothetical protein [Alphaproteobacteria bacterium]